jgi:Domain of unknown function (DUF4157)/DNA/RNA non-specific endonuclease
MMRVLPHLGRQHRGSSPLARPQFVPFGSRTGPFTPSEDVSGLASERAADHLAQTALGRPPPSPRSACNVSVGLPDGARAASPPVPPVRGGTPSTQWPQEVHAVLRQPGQPLPEPVRREFETRFGHDFARVRIHADPLAARAADATDARAFAVGRHLVFGAQQFRPADGSGRALLAHELAHVLQQSGQGGAPALLQREPRAKGKIKPVFDVSRLSDEDKAKARDAIRSETAAALEKLKEEVAKWPAPSAAEVAAAQAMRKRFDGFVKQAESRPDTDPEKAIRVRSLKAHRALLDNEFFMRVEYRFVQDNTPLISMTAAARMADPADKADAEQLAIWNDEARLSAGGGSAVLFNELRRIIYRRYGLTPKDLETSDKTQAEQDADAQSTTPVDPSAPQTAPADPVPKPPTAEDKARLREVYEAIPKSEGEAQVSDESAVMKQLAQMTPEDLDDFKRFARASKKPNPDDPNALSLDKLLEEFRKLTTAEREALEINLDLQEQPDQKTQLDGKVELALKSASRDSATTKAELRKTHSQIELLRSLIRDPQLMKDIPSLDLGFETVLEEVLMLEGLLAGAADQSPLAGQVAKTLTAEIKRARWELTKKLGAAAAEAGGLAALAVLTKGGSALFTGARMVRLAKLMKDLRDTIVAVKKAYDVYQRVTVVIQTVRGLGQAYEDFKSFYGAAVTTMDKLQTGLGDIDSSEDLEEKLAAQEDQLMDELDELLEGQFGEILEHFYIPDDTSTEELLRILTNIPRGLDRLGEMWDFYSSPGGNDPERETRLMQRAFHAGSLLHPFVAMLGALVSAQVSAITANAQLGLTMDTLVPGSKRSGGKGRNRGMFRRLNRKRYDISDETLAPVVKEGAAALEKLIDDDEPGSPGAEHWTPDWFKLVMRRELKVLNRNFQGRTVSAKVKDKGAKKAAKGAATETVPLPPFRLKVHRAKKADTKVRATLKLNPEADVKVDRLSDDDFKVPVPFTGTDNKRQGAIREWLQEADYKLTKDPAGSPHIRLPDGKEENAKRHYLRIDSAGAIVHGIGVDDHKPFLGATVSESNDLPEGYLVAETAKGVEVRRKDGVERKYSLPPLGLDPNHQLVAGKQKPVPREIAPPGVTEATQTEGYDWMLPAQSMQSASSVYNLQGKGRPQWDSHIKRTEGLKRRPKQAVGNLGYTVNARSASDRLASFHLPQLKSEDDKGHIVARRFGGVDSYDNLVPMLRSLNQAPGKWFDVEHDMAKVYTSKSAKPGHYVRFSVDMQYAGRGTRRPSKFKVSWKEHKSAKIGTLAPNDPVVEAHPLRVLDND